tara:strand:- start:138 stop:929 length:792 start_codon:yes stop_codon:yes gene_type:complete
MINEHFNYWLSIQGIEKIINIFNKEKFDIRFIGGCVRDAFLGKKNADIDLAINCEPNCTISILKKNNIEILDYAKQYGSITAVIKKNSFQITSLRQDFNQDGRNTEVKFTQDWEKDALRRDFTFNAISVNSDGKIIDYFDGIEDLNLKQVKFIGDIEKRIKEDYLRIFRYYRFLGIFDKPKIKESYDEIILNNMSYALKKLSNEIIRVEILKMLNNFFPINSFSNNCKKKQKRKWLDLTQRHFIKTKYDLGLKKCLNQVDQLF